jgi:uncharacterized protein with FMN-binding domain
MTRIFLAISGTVVALVALLGFKTHGSTTTTQALPAISAPSSSTATSGSAAGSTSAPPDPTSSSAAPKASATPSATTRTIAGDAVQTRYGTVQVQVVVAGSKIQSVSFLQLTADDPRSADINQQAAPILLQETMQAQSSQIDSVSGATYTSDGYLQSLQSALDQAGIK